MLYVLVFPFINTYCEETWILNTTSISNINSNITYTPELGNAISSLTYTCFGIVGLIPKYQSPLYYVIMNLFILTGIGSFLHHYFYPNIKWAWASDVIAMEIIAPFSLFYIICDAYNPFINKFLGFICISSCFTMLIFFKINNDIRGDIFRGIIISIVASQIPICYYFFSHNFTIRYKILKSQIFSGLIFGLGVGGWYLDMSCPRWLWYINTHALWHILVAWALFNTINISCAFHAIIKNIDYSWKSPFSKTDWLLFIVILKKDLPKNKYYELELSKIITISNNKCHKRSSTIG